MSDFPSALKSKQLVAARTMTRDEAIQYNYRSGSQNPTKSFDIESARDLNIVFGYFTVPPYSVAFSFKTYGELLFQYEVSLPSNFFIKKVEFTDITLYSWRSVAIYIKWRVDNVVHRYLLKGTQSKAFNGVFLPSPIVNSYPSYEEQMIGKNCVIEFVRWGESNGFNPFDVGLFCNMKITTSIFRLPSSGSETEYNVATPVLKTFNDLKITLPFNVPQACTTQFLNNTGLL